MKKLILILAVGFAAWQFHFKHQDRQTITSYDSNSFTAQPASPSLARSYSCDGRTYCSQMSSCEEATYFLQHCPGVKMDGNNDGVPCEQQWCN
ncbi:excalibur calcium-binding domain-containing protein [Pseudomonas sp. D(2018)]|uniref:excalibur calcium-binding domain-containing protein n=1 Tax=Pseudomonadaceae TaxID=135621 RepID=UPI0010F75D8C|nr:excalibur calcium-binding domain-containing protein [Pseudomonas sp. D(2018)]